MEKCKTSTFRWNVYIGGFMKVNILGTEYEIIEGNAIDHPLLKQYSGYCDYSTKEIIITTDTSDWEVDDIETIKKEILRHELIHAFLVESGLNKNCDWHNEEMVDWLAIQFNKIKDVFKACDI